MSESKIDVWKRKIRNGKRRAKIIEHEKVWETLASQPKRKGVLVSPGVSVSVTDYSWVIPNDGMVEWKIK